MIFTQEDKLKLASNVAAMVDYIKENIQPRVSGEITVHFGGKHTCVRSGNSTEMYHLRVEPKSIEYAVKFGSYTALEPGVVASYPGEMLDLVKNWMDVKCMLNVAVQNQEDDRKAIYDFKV